MAACLGDDARACVDEDDGEVGRGASSNHVAGVLFVSRCVGDDELSTVRAEITIGHVDGDAFLTFGLQTVEQQGVVDVVAGIALALGVAFKGCQLVVIEFL